MSVVHRGTHRALLPGFTMGRRRRVDAIVVPAGRTAEHLAPAAQLASELDCLLVVICPDGADPAAFADLATRNWRRLPWQPLFVPADYTHRLLPRTASQPVDPELWRHGPLSTMRNLALLLARILGWRTVLLVDDDIGGLDPGLIGRATYGLDSHSAVAFRVDDYPDNSVVCHASRLAGHKQDVFVGASALMIDTHGTFGFFPNVYNGDWLFLYDAIRLGQVACLDRVSQLPYDPYNDTDRAAAEEFGDIIAEGLMASLLTRRARIMPPVERRYWSNLLEARRTFIERAYNGLDSQPSSAEIKSALKALEAAERRRANISAEHCTSFVGEWRGNVGQWRRSVHELPTLTDFEAAANHLGLTGSLVGRTS